MTDIVLTPITSGYNLSKINANFVKVQDVINNEVIHSTGGNNVMHQDLDMNDFSLINLGTDVDNPDSVLTVAEGDLRYYNVTGDTLTGPMDAGGQVVANLPVATASTQAVRKSQLDDESLARIAADTALAAQIGGATPVGSQFSPVSWHSQVITNSVAIPAGMNGWSFGPLLSIAPGQTVTIGSGSFWTIAEGTLAP